MTRASDESDVSRYVAYFGATLSRRKYQSVRSDILFARCWMQQRVHFAFQSVMLTSSVLPEIFEFYKFMIFHSHQNTRIPSIFQARPVQVY